MAHFLTTIFGSIYHDQKQKYGIHSGMPLRTARTLCPKAVFLPVDFEAYEAASRQFKRVLLSVTTIMEDVGIDEAFLDISDEKDSSGVIAEKIKAGIYEQTGLTCSVGIAPNKLLAKIASDMQKPDGLTIIDENDVQSKLWPLPMRKLYGVGPRTEEQLKKMGIDTIGKLAATPKINLIQHFGPSYGEYLYDAARGIDDSPLITHWEPKSFSRETTFQLDVRNWQMIAKTIAGLTKEVVADMIKKGYRAKTVTLKIRFDDFRTTTRSSTMEDYSASEQVIRKSAFTCLKRIDLIRKVRLIGVRVTNLEKIEMSQDRYKLL